MKMCKAKITFLKAGPYTSVQDLGRFGYAEFGIPTSGFMDKTSAGLANMLINNPKTAACFEIFAGGVILKVDQSCLLCAAGAVTDLKVGTQIFQTNQPIILNVGEELEIFPFRVGQWLYLAFAGDILVPEPFGSKSFYYPITTHSRLKNGDVVEAMLRSPRYPQTNSRLRLRDWRTSKNLFAFPGSDFHLLSHAAELALTQTSFTLSPTLNRMGIQFLEPLRQDLPDILSSPVFPGTVQLTPSGKLIVLMRDAQVTGGYPRILQLTDASISLLSQKRPGESVKFTMLPLTKLALSG